MSAFEKVLFVANSLVQSRSSSSTSNFATAHARNVAASALRNRLFDKARKVAAFLRQPIFFPCSLCSIINLMSVYNSKIRSDIDAKDQSIVFVMFICIENIWVINEQNFMSVTLLSWDRKLC